MTKKAVILLSGGLDSATVLALAKSEEYEIYAISFSYGQRHNVELDKAREIAKSANVTEHKIVEIDLRAFGGSALTDDIAVPKSDNVDDINDEIPVTYVPARNLIFLSYALGYAETLQSQNIFIGVNALDYSGYPDCRPDFIKSFEQTANFATAAGIGDKKFTIHTPLMEKTKAEIIKLGLELGVDYSKTLSCYDPIDGDKPCGHCDSCLLRNKGFSENRMTDPSI